MVGFSELDDGATSVTGISLETELVEVPSKEPSISGTPDISVLETGEELSKGVDSVFVLILTSTGLTVVEVVVVVVVGSGSTGTGSSTLCPSDLTRLMLLAGLTLNSIGSKGPDESV